MSQTGKYAEDNDFLDQTRLMAVRNRSRAPAFLTYKSNNQLQPTETATHITIDPLENRANKRLRDSTTQSVVPFGSLDVIFGAP
jgi:hypothetical protein